MLRIEQKLKYHCQQLVWLVGTARSLLLFEVFEFKPYGHGTSVFWSTSIRQFEWEIFGLEIETFFCVCTRKRRLPSENVSGINSLRGGSFACLYRCFVQGEL